METSGRGSSEKAMIIIPAVVGLFAVTLVAGRPVQFVRIVNDELRSFATAVVDVLGSWF